MPVNISIFSSPKAPSTYAAERLESKPSGEWELRNKPNCADPIQVDECRGEEAERSEIRNRSWKRPSRLTNSRLILPDPPATK